MYEDELRMDPARHPWAEHAGRVPEGGLAGSSGAHIELTRSRGAPEMSLVGQIRAQQEPAPPRRPVVQSRFFVLAALAVIVICFVYLGRAARPESLDQPAVKVIVSGEQSWDSSTRSFIRSAGRMLRVGLFRYVRLPRNVPAHLAGMILCTALAGILLMSSQFRFR